MTPFNADAPDEAAARARNRRKPLKSCPRCGAMIVARKAWCSPCWDIVRGERAIGYARAAHARRKAGAGEQTPSETT